LQDEPEDENGELSLSSDVGVGDEEVYLIMRVTPRKVVLPSYRPDGSVLSYDDPLDYGLDDANRKFRRTTQSWCSCGFFTAFGGLPCRHMLLIYMLRQENQYPIELIRNKWIQRTLEQERDLHMVLHRTLPPQLCTSRLRASGASTLSRSERYKQFMAEARIAAELVCSKPDDFARVFEMLQSITERIRTGNFAEHELNGGDTAVPGEAGSPQHASDVTHQSPDGQPRRAPASATDAKDLINALGLLFEADDPPTEEDCQTPGKFVNRYIAFKWAAKKCGGWHLGKIEEQEDDGVTYVATYASDGATGQHELPFALHTTVTKMLHIPACLHHAHICMRLCRLKQSPCICVLRKPRHVSAAGCC
jgi:hypothetical protein